MITCSVQLIVLTISGCRRIETAIALAEKELLLRNGSSAHRLSIGSPGLMVDLYLSLANRHTALGLVGYFVENDPVFAAFVLGGKRGTKSLHGHEGRLAITGDRS